MSYLLLLQIYLQTHVVESPISSHENKKALSSFYNKKTFLIENGW